MQLIELAAALSADVREHLGAWRLADLDHEVAYRALAGAEVGSDARELALLNEEITRRHLVGVEHSLRGAVQELFGLK